MHHNIRNPFCPLQSKSLLVLLRKSEFTVIGLNFTLRGREPTIYENNRFGKKHGNIVKNNVLI